MLGLDGGAADGQVAQGGLRHEAVVQDDAGRGLQQPAPLQVIVRRRLEHLVDGRLEIGVPQLLQVAVIKRLVLGEIHGKTSHGHSSKTTVGGRRRQEEGEGKKSHPRVHRPEVIEPLRCPATTPLFPRTKITDSSKREIDFSSGPNAGFFSLSLSVSPYSVPLSLGRAGV